jgi:hypothetical protein
MDASADLAAIRARRDRLLYLLEVAHARLERRRALIEQDAVIADGLTPWRRPSPRAPERKPPALRRSEGRGAAALAATG